MKKIIPFFLILTLFISAVGQTQDNRTLETKIADILAQMPAGDITYRDRLVTELIDLGGRGFSGLADMLQVPGTGDDAAVRMAINSMARYASQTGREKERTFVEKNLLEAISTTKEKAIQRFLIHQLNLVGSDLSVQALKPFLHDKDLCEPATQALLSIRSEKAKAALLEALQEEHPNGNITLIKALGELRYQPATAVISQFVGSKNRKVQRVTLQTLANIGDPSSYKTLWNVARLTPQYDPTLAVSSFITYLGRLGQEKEMKPCKKGIMSMMKKCREPSLLHYRAGTMEVYARYFGEEALPTFYTEVKNKDKAYRSALLATITHLGNEQVTKKWLAIARKADPDVRADILLMLGQRGDKTALAFIQQQVNDPHEKLRTAAISSLVKLEGKAALPLLLDHLKTGKDISYTQNILLTLTGEKDLPAVSRAAGKAEGEAKAACLAIIAARNGTAFFPMIRDLCHAGDKTVRKAAYEALPGVADARALDDLMQLLLTTNAPEYTGEVRKAIVVASKNNVDPRKVTEKLLSALRATDQKARIIALLPSIGGKESLSAVVNIFQKNTGDTKNAAFNALLQWEGTEAIPFLFRICQEGPTTYRGDAFKSYVKKIDESTLPDDQKLLQLRKIMPLAGNTQEKKQVINALGNLHTFLTAVYLGKFLDDPEVQSKAAWAITTVALPASSGFPGLIGKIIRERLTRSLKYLSGTESEYQKAKVQDYLEKMPDEVGFVSMFNGKDLTGWKGFVANPLKLAEISKKELKKRQQEANRKMHDNWSVNENSIVFNGKGSNLVSEKTYGNFEMWVDWRITKGGDSGIYLRGSPQVQIWDTSRRNVGAQVGSGGLYNNKHHRSTPLKVADNPINDWNTFHIIMVDSIVTVWLNGELVVDHIPLENYWDRNRPIFPTGTIELQAHGSNLAFRNIYIRKISDKEYHLSPKEKKAGFQSLFNGKNLQGWTGNKVDYVVENGTIVVHPKEGSHGNLYTEKEYRDFDFRFEFKLTPGANNGIGIRAPLKGDAAYVGMEIQVLDNTAPIYAHLQPYQYHGSVYGVIPAKRGYLKPVGEWNSEEIIAKGSHIKVILNDHVILDGDIKEASKNGTMDHKDHPGLLREKGHIGFLGHGSVVWFRNVRIKEL